MIRTKMGEEKQSCCRDVDDPKLVDASRGGGGGECYESESSMGDSLVTDESSSCSSSELAEDASSSTLCSSSSSSSSSSSTSLSNCQGPLYELSDLMTHLPIKRGLSKFYQGKSQSFTSLARVQSIEDLVKKESPHRKRLKMCKSFAGHWTTMARSHTAQGLPYQRRVRFQRVLFYPLLLHRAREVLRWLVLPWIRALWSRPSIVEKKKRKLARDRILKLVRQKKKL
ncbi:uncharacterized protein J3R85_011613 [Psidium guajava]|nr:uncharacterized protein J3R85_011613 [Psidium guajava]